MGVRTFVAQPLTIGVPMGLEWEINRDYYLKLAESLVFDESKILLINHCNNVEGHFVRGLCSVAEDAVLWMDKLNDEARLRGLGENRFSFCMDIGAYNLCGINMHETARVLGKRVQAVIVRDNDGHSNNAMLPFTSVIDGNITTDWLSCVRGLREIDFDGDMIMDMTDTMKCAPSMIRPATLTYGKVVAEHVRSVIQIEEPLKKYKQIAVFGVGDLGRGFIRSYADKYNILFACDNNEARWGSFVDDIEVKSPECLKDVPEGTGVIICNMYHREIKEQLISMGVKNIECVDGEFMPTFNQARVGREVQN